MISNKKARSVAKIIRNDRGLLKQCTGSLNKKTKTMRKKLFKKIKFCLSVLYNSGLE